MSTQIIAETCPAPECNLSPKDVEQFVEELRAYHEQFAPAFRRPEQARWSEVYLRGLLGDSPRKTVERIALDLCERARLAVFHRPESVGAGTGCGNPSAAGG